MISTGNVFLTVRGKTTPATIDAARKLHNQTAGDPRGVAAARALGDYSHNVYVPIDGVPGSARPGELVFHDVWESPKGLMEFFSNPDVQKGAAALFATRDAAVWMPAVGALSYGFSAPARKGERYIGMVRGQISSPEQTIELFNQLHGKTMKAARQLGQMSHQLFIKMNPPGDNSPLEALGVDVWFDPAGMAEHYKTLDMASLAPAFVGAPDPSVWQAAPGEWVEW